MNYQQSVVDSFRVLNNLTKDNSLNSSPHMCGQYFVIQYHKASFLIWIIIRQILKLLLIVAYLGKDRIRFDT